jgi:opacity protein-like surface antigen
LDCASPLALCPLDELPKSQWTNWISLFNMPSMHPKHMAILLYTILLLAAVSVNAQSTNKSAYTLFNTTPNDQLRPLSSEAYDGFTDARTLDAGHVQIEGEFINAYFNAAPLSHAYPPVGYPLAPGVTTVYVTHYSSYGFDWAPRLTVGLSDNVDFFVRPSYEINTTENLTTSTTTSQLFSPITNTSTSDRKETISELGTMTTGVKVNLWGNDSGITALAIRPYLVLPMGNNDDDVGAGVDLPLLVRLPDGFLVKFDSEFYTAGDNDNFAGFGNDMSINKSLGPKADVYGYFDTTVTSDSSDTWYGYVGFGLDYNFTSNLQMFAGIGLGVTAPGWTWGQSHPYDYNPRLGFVWRL